MCIASRCWVVLLGLGSSAIASSSFAQTAFDDFLSRDNPCYGSPAFKAYVGSLYNKYGSVGNKSTKLVIPEALKSSLGEPVAKNKGEYTFVEVPVVDAKYYDVPVVGLSFTIGNENGISGNSIVFSEPLQSSRGRVGNLVKKVNKKLKRDMAEVCGPTCDHIWLRTHKKGSELSCDVST